MRRRTGSLYLSCACGPPVSAPGGPSGGWPIETDPIQCPDGRRVILVTGAARRIGAAIARDLHRRGCDLALHYRHSQADIAALTDELESARAGSVLSLQADLARVDRLPGLIAAAIDRYGRLDGLVNNASAFFATPMGTLSAPQLDTLFTVNVTAPLLLAQAAAPHLRRSRGAIVNLVDIYAETPKAGFLAYSASRAAMSTVTTGLAAELAPEVRVNAVAPGAILWPEESGNQADRKAIMDSIPLGRTGTPDEIAHAVSALLLDLTYVTGQVLRVDGGRTATV